MSEYDIYTVGAGAIALAVMLGLMIGRLGKERLRLEATKVTGLHNRLARAENQVTQQNQQLAQMASDQGTVSSLALTLPSVVRQLNRADLEPRDVPPLILQLAEAIFQPRQILLYTLRRLPDASGKLRPVLRLITHKGLQSVHESIKQIDIGEGKIGWVASNRLDMLDEDWQHLSRADGVTVQNNHPSLRLDVIGPLVRHHRDREQLLGVLCIGAAGTHPREEKLMFQMVTNLGSLALVNAMHVNVLKDQANHDGLTSLLNKRCFMEKLSETIVTAEKEAQPLTLFIFDIDHFKTYNDTNGHPAGDELLRRLSALLKQQMRPRDLCCRYGGEEFMVAMPRTDSKEGFAAAERIRSVIEEQDFPHQEKQPGGNLTISGGVAVFPTASARGDELIQCADDALYESKAKGRNQLTLFRTVGIGDMNESDCDSDSEPAAEPGLVQR